jgi:hypothetical protein
MCWYTPAHAARPSQPEPCQQPHETKHLVLVPRMLVALRFRARRPAFVVVTAATASAGASSAVVPLPMAAVHEEHAPKDQYPHPVASEKREHDQSLPLSACDSVCAKFR